MRWFKHISDAAEDEKLARILVEFGPEGYGIWWLIVEIVARQMDKTDRHHASYPLSIWVKKTGVYHHKKLRAVIQSLHNLCLISAQCMDNLCIMSELSMRNVLTISIPKLLNLRDEYTKKSG